MVLPDRRTLFVSLVLQNRHQDTAARIELGATGIL